MTGRRVTIADQIATVSRRRLRSRAVERGRQSITLDAALEIEEGLRMGMAELLEEGWR